MRTQAKTIDRVDRMHGISPKPSQINKLYGITPRFSESETIKKRNVVKKTAQEGRVCDISKILTNSRDEFLTLDKIFTTGEIVTSKTSAGYIVSDKDGVNLFLVAIKYEMCCEAFVKILPSAKRKYDSKMLMNVIPSTLKTDKKRKFLNA